MSGNEGIPPFLPHHFPSNETMIDNNQSDPSLKPALEVYIAFYIGEIISIISILFGILGNSALIFTIYRSSFSRFPYGLLLLFIALFDIIRLISTALYYLFQAYIIPFNIATMTIYIILYRYPKNVTNWLKVFLAFERILAVKYCIANRYNINSINQTKTQRAKQTRTLSLIFLLLLCSLISQHPDLIPYRYISPHIDPSCLLLVVTPNPKFYYGAHLFNGTLFTIISYIILDDGLPITALIVLNTILLSKLRRLPLIANEKIASSIWILFFLTIFSVFALPHSVLVLFNLYVNPTKSNDRIISVAFNLFLGLEIMNHGITGYACFLTSQNLRKALRQSFQMIFKKLPKKNLYTIDL